MRLAEAGDDLGWQRDPFQDVNVKVGPPDYQFNDVVDFIPEYIIADDVMKFRDPLWGECTIGEREGDEVFLDMINSNPLILRSMMIEQLTLTPEYSTMPNTGLFSRWEHIWGSVAFVRKMIDENDELQRLTSREQLILQLRTFVSDLAHTAGSHLGDWLMQGFGGDEDQHDNELMWVLEASGVLETLARHGIDPEEVVFPDIDDWIENSAPKGEPNRLCVDRVDYGLREINRWMGGMAYMHPLREGFAVVDGQLVMKDQQQAELFTRAYSILATEHWGHPVHRLQLVLLQEMVRDSLIQDEVYAIRDIARGPSHPHDALYTADNDIYTHHLTSDELMWSLRPLMLDIGREERDRFVKRRHSQLASYVAGYRGGEGFPFPDPTDLRREDGGSHHHMPIHNTRVIVQEVDGIEDVPDFGKNEYMLDQFLPPLKPRMINPDVITDEGIVPLSQLYDNFATIKKQQKAIVDRAYVARVLIHPEYGAMIKDRLELNKRLWQQALARDRLGSQALGKVIDEATFFYLTHTLVRIRPLFRKVMGDVVFAPSESE